MQKTLNVSFNELLQDDPKLAEDVSNYYGIREEK